MGRWWHRHSVGILIAFGLVAAACGSGDSTTIDTSGASASTAAAVTAGTEAPPAAPQPTVAGTDRSSELVGRWRIVNYALPDGGGLTNVVGDAPVFMEFGADGTLAYGTGCNEGSVPYVTSGAYVIPKSALDDTPEGQPITIGPTFTQTEIGCEGFLGDQDRDLPTDMGKATRFRIDDDRLLLLDEFLLIQAERG